jgi:hypothetical protein
MKLLEGTGLRQLEAGGCTYWMGEDASRRATAGTPVRLLQAFDEYVIGYTESRRVLAVAGKPDVPNGAPLHSNVLTRDGQVIGVWRGVPDPEEALVELHLARPLDAATRSALEDELERYGHFLQMPVRLLAKPRAAHGRRPHR